MKLDDRYLDIAYAEANIKQKAEELIRDGYRLIPDSPFDLLVEKNGHKRVYEFKYRNGDRRTLKLEEIRKRAEKEGAEFIVVYMLRPNRDSIEFDDLGELIMEYFTDNFPSDLDELSSHTRLSEVYVEAITDISLTERDITIKGEASVTVSLQYGSDREQEEDEEEECMTFPMDFEASMNWNREITDMDYEIDTSDI